MFLNISPVLNTDQEERFRSNQWFSRRRMSRRDVTSFKVVVIEDHRKTSLPNRTCLFFFQSYSLFLWRTISSFLPVCIAMECFSIRRAPFKTSSPSPSQYQSHDPLFAENVLVLRQSSHRFLDVILPLVNRSPFDTLPLPLTLSVQNETAYKEHSDRVEHCSHRYSHIATHFVHCNLCSPSYRREWRTQKIGTLSAGRSITHFLCKIGLISDDRSCWTIGKPTECNASVPENSFGIQRSGWQVWSSHCKFRPFKRLFGLHIFQKCVNSVDALISDDVLHTFRPCQFYVFYNRDFSTCADKVGVNEKTFSLKTLICHDDLQLIAKKEDGIPCLKALFTDVNEVSSTLKYS